MKSKLFTAAFLVLFLAGDTLGQNANLQPKPETMTVDELTESVIALQDQLRKVAEIVGQNSTDVGDVKTDVSGMKNDMAGVIDQQKTTTVELQSVTNGMSQIAEQQKTIADELKVVSEGLSAITQQQQTTADKLQEVFATLNSMSTDKSQLEDQIKEINVQLGQLKVSQDEFETVTSEQIAENKTQLGQISRNVGGSQTLRFDSVQDEASMQDFRNLVNRTMPKRGVLVVENKMPIVQYISINRKDYYLGPDERREFEVPVGNVSTQLRGQKVVNWTLAAPNYKETVQIVRDEPMIQTTTTVSAPVVYQPSPIYVDSFGFVTLP